jgi:hypothetical protein
MLPTLFRIIGECAAIDCQGVMRLMTTPVSNVEIVR